ncbi:MAG TPA: hypothetical protein VN476_18750 [Pyrinomonadaceae bacterium]|nr:hypothetical protein [Pyrinomonadaceae bacterium]
MTENDHDNLSYSGTVGEQVIVSVTGQNTNSLGTFALKGPEHVPIPLDGIISFQLDPGLNTLQLILDSTTNNGSYRVVVRTSQNEPNNECVHVWVFHGNVMVKDFVFGA